MTKQENATCREKLLAMTVPGILAFIKSPNFRAGKFNHVLESLRKESGFPVEMGAFGFGKDATNELRAWSIITTAQSRHWRREFETLDQAIKDSGLEDQISSAEFSRFLKSGDIEAINAWSRARRKEMPRSNRISRGRGSVEVSYSWLATSHLVPAFREALGVSRSGFEKMAARLKIGIVRSTAKRKLAGTITRESALAFLNERLKICRAGDEHAAQRIWDSYGRLKENEPGFAELKRILEAYGANCAQPVRRATTLFGAPSVAHS